jgi:hypothetical protein
VQGQSPASSIEYLRHSMACPVYRRLYCGRSCFVTTSGSRIVVRMVEEEAQHLS